MPLVKTLERHYAACASLAYRQLLRRGHEAGREGSRGEFRVPYAATRRRDPEQPTTFILTPRTIKKAGPRVKARLNHVEMRNLPGMANTMNLFKSLRLPIRPLLEMAGFANAHELLREGQEEELMYGAETTPFQRFSMLLEDTKNGDGSYDVMRAVALWSLITGGQQGQGGPPGGGGPPPMGGGMGGGGLPVNTSAMDLSPQNFPQANVGMGAGRPVSTGAGLGMGGPPGMPPAF